MSVRNFIIKFQFLLFFINCIKSLFFFLVFALYRALNCEVFKMLVFSGDNFNSRERVYLNTFNIYYSFIKL